MTGGGRRPPVAGLSVYSVDDRSVQMTWRGLGADHLRLGAGPSQTTSSASPPATLQTRGGRERRLGRLRGGPGSAVVGGLEPDTDYEVWAEAPGADRTTVARVRTLVRPAGRLVCQLATLTDIHVGERHFGLLGLIEDRRDAASALPYPLRSAGAALAEARAWGADHVVVKGDLTRDSRPAEFRAVGEMLSACGMTVDVVLGNHDVRHGVDAAAMLGGFGIDAAPVARFRDLPGLRIILAHTPGPGDKWGLVRSDQADRIARLARSTPGPCMLVVHHPPATAPVTLHYPPGIYRGSSRELLRRLTAANPASFVVAGHTHRNRLHRAAGIVCAETSSTKDYPGQWTGYRVFEHGVVQTARRIADPHVLAWTESTGRALGGQWGRWSPGTLADRSWSMPWPAR